MTVLTQSPFDVSILAAYPFSLPPEELTIADRLPQTVANVGQSPEWRYGVFCAVLHCGYVERQSWSGLADHMRLHAHCGTAEYPLSASVLPQNGSRVMQVGQCYVCLSPTLRLSRDERHDWQPQYVCLHCLSVMDAWQLQTTTLPQSEAGRHAPCPTWSFRSRVNRGRHTTTDWRTCACEEAAELRAWQADDDDVAAERLMYWQAAK